MPLEEPTVYTRRMSYFPMRMANGSTEWHGEGWQRISWISQPGVDSYRFTARINNIDPRVYEVLLTAIFNGKVLDTTWHRATTLKAAKRWVSTQIRTARY